MVRPRKIKIVNFEPGVTYFKPRAVPLSALEEVDLTVDELETLRLSNLRKLSQASAAKKMKIHQSTFQRTLTRAREKVTDALVNGKAIKIHGGDYRMPLMSDLNGSKGKSGSVAGGRGRMGGPFSAGPGGVCKCPKCGYERPHVRGQPCNQRKCPRCNTMMIRSN